MTLHLVVHRPEETPGSETDAALRAALRDAIWEVAESHWSPGGDVVFASSDLSPEYLVAHFRRSLARRGFPEAGMLVVTPLGEKAAWSGMPADVEAWITGAA